MRATTGSWRTAAAVAVVVLAVGATAVGPALAASSWTAPAVLSTPIPPTDVVESPSVAVNASGAEVAAWDDQAADGTQFVHVRTSADGRTWSSPTTLGRGVEVAVALAPDGRAVGSSVGATSLAIAPGRAVVMWAWGGAAVSSKPVP